VTHTPAATHTLQSRGASWRIWIRIAMILFLWARVCFGSAQSRGPALLMWLWREPRRRARVERKWACQMKPRLQARVVNVKITWLIKSNEASVWINGVRNSRHLLGVGRSSRSRCSREISVALYVLGMYCILVHYIWLENL